MAWLGVESGVKSRIRRQRLQRAEVFPRAAEAIQEISSWKWPKGAGRTVPEAVIASWKSYEDWIERLDQVAITDPRLDRFRKHLLSILPSPSWVVSKHFDYVLRYVSYRSDFRGDLRPWSWNLSRKEADEMGCDWATEWSGSSDLWHELKAVMH